MNEADIRSCEWCEATDSEGYTVEDVEVVPEGETTIQTLRLCEWCKDELEYLPTDLKGKNGH